MSAANPAPSDDRLIVVLFEAGAAMDRRHRAAPSSPMASRGVDDIVSEMVRSVEHVNTARPSFRIAILSYGDTVDDWLDGVRPFDDEVRRYWVHASRNIAWGRGGANAVVGFQRVATLLQHEMFGKWSGSPILVVHITTGQFTDDDPEPVVRSIMEMSSWRDQVTIETILMSDDASERGPTAQYWHGFPPAVTDRDARLRKLAAISSRPDRDRLDDLRRHGVSRLWDDAPLLLPGLNRQFVHLGLQLWHGFPMLAPSAPEPPLAGSMPAPMAAGSMPAPSPSASTWEPATAAMPVFDAMAAASSAPSEEAPAKPLYVDENVQFTVYRPRTVRPARWYDLMAFAHLSERRPGSDEPDPVEEVQRQARQVIGDRFGEYRSTVQDSTQAVPHRGQLTFVPEVPGVEFNPPTAS